MKYEIHPAADAFPMMMDTEFDDLKANIAEHGLLVPVVLCEGKILDGRNRYKACEAIGVPIRTEDYHGNPWEYVWSLNGERRNLPGGHEQKYAIWKYVNEQSGEWQARQEAIKTEANRKRAEAAKERERRDDGTFEPVVAQNVQPVDTPKEAKTREAKAAASGVGRGAVERIDTMANKRPDLVEKIRTGEMKPAEARRQMKKTEVQEKTRSLPKGKYRVIYADPPWKYADGRTGDKMTATGALHHYPTMTLSELKALDIQSLASDDSVLFLWATCPLLEDALELARAWGFQYKAQFIWDKVKHNMGHYNSVRHEILLICTRGAGTPDKVNLFDSVQSIERTEHSKKPEAFRDIIDALYEGPRIELFARGKAPSPWKVWGNESHE